MSKTLLTGGCLLLMLTACATPTPGPATKLAARAALPAPGCVPETATRIPLKTDECAEFGHSHSQAELLRTGAVDTAEALRLLDPALTVRGR